MVIAAVVAVAAILYVPIARDLPLSLVLFFFAGISGALVARGVAYSGRFSTILIGSACALAIATVALLTRKADLRVNSPGKSTPIVDAPHGITP
jgi:hypothetical protein